MRVLQINSVCGIRSTGRICTDIADILKKNGVKSALVNLGGNVHAVGSKPDGADGLIPTEGVDEDNDRPEDNIFASLIRFLTSLINVLVKLFKDGFKK